MDSRVNSDDSVICAGTPVTAYVSKVSKRSSRAVRVVAVPHSLQTQEREKVCSRRGAPPRPRRARGFRSLGPV